MIKPLIIETNTNTANIWHVKRGERRRDEEWGEGGWEGVKAQMREKTSSCLTQQHRPYFILCAVNQLEASEQTGREGAGEGGRDSKRGNRPGRKKGSGLLGRRRAIDPGLTLRGTDVDTDRCVVQYSQPFSSDILRRLPHYQPLSLAFPHILFTHSEASYRRINHSQRRERKVELPRKIIGVIAPDMAVQQRPIRGWWGSIPHSQNNPTCIAHFTASFNLTTLC